MREKILKMNIKNERAITLIALVVTIIVLLILAGISIGVLNGENGIIKNAGKAKESAEIAEEKDQLGIAAAQVMEKSKYGDITKVGLNKELEKLNSSMPTSIEYDEEISLFYVTFTGSGRVYQVDRDGNITYLGNEAELKNSARITANPEWNLTPQLIQFVDLKIETFVGLEDDEIFVHYAWTNNEDQTPESSDYAAITYTVNANKKRRTVTLTSEDTQEGNYYLWVQLVFNENTITKKFGPYAIKDHTTLVATNKETATDSGFLGNTQIPRNKIRSVTITNSFGTHETDETSWDVSASQDGRYLAWGKAITDETDGTYYDVIIEGKGGVVANTNASYLFANIGSGLTNQEVTITGLEYLDTGLVTIMDNMFKSCNKITSLDVSKFDTSNVTSTYWMFFCCSKLVNLDVSNFNTSNMKSMTRMFYGCNNLRDLDVSNFDTSKVTSMYMMFWGCNNLTTLDVSKFDTSNVTEMPGMFYGCSGLTSLDVSEFDTSKVTNMNEMFRGCSGLTSLDVSEFNTSNVKKISGMFRECSGLTSLDVTKFNTSSVTSMNEMFYNCSKLTSLDVTKFNTSNVTNMQSMFLGCSGLTNLDITKFNTNNVTNMSSMFYGCSGLTNLDVTKFNTSSVTTMQSMFSGCNGLISLDITKFDTSNVTNMNAMFYNCNQLTSLDILNFNTSSVTAMNGMFAHCKALTTLDLSNFDTKQVINMTEMFYNCQNLVTIYIGDNWDDSNVTSNDRMFSYCPKLVGEINGRLTYKSSN